MATPPREATFRDSEEEGEFSSKQCHRLLVFYFVGLPTLFSLGSFLLFEGIFQILVLVIPHWDFWYRHTHYSGLRGVTYHHEAFLWHDKIMLAVILLTFLFGLLKYWREARHLTSKHISGPFILTTEERAPFAQRKTFARDTVSEIPLVLLVVLFFATAVALTFGIKGHFFGDEYIDMSIWHTCFFIFHASMTFRVLGLSHRSGMHLVYFLDVGRFHLSPHPFHHTTLPFRTGPEANNRQSD